jgi:hypothetical protein
MYHKLMTVSLLLAGSRNAFPGNTFLFPWPHFPPKQKHISISIVRELESEAFFISVASESVGSE